MRALSIITATLLCYSLAQAQDDLIIDTITGEKLNRAQLLEILARNDYVLLGELHGNQEHHRLRGALIRDLKAMQDIAVVAEHMEQGRLFQNSGDLKADLEASGFDAEGWRWPLHHDLFAPVVEAGIPLVGGNISRKTARNAVRQGSSALPLDTSDVIEHAPLETVAQSTLDDDLIQSHCGHLPTSMLEGLRLAQRARDAAMFSSIQQVDDTKTVVLVAGNGHVRLDYGVPSMIRAYQPASRLVSVGFIETPDGVQPEIGSSPRRYDYIWAVPATENREDPCLKFKKPKAQTTQS